MKTVRRKKINTKAKSRTIARPALQKRTPGIVGRVWSSFLAPALYVVAVLILFQFVSIRLALGYYEGPTPQSPSRLAVQAKQPRVKAPTTKGIPLRIEIPKVQVSAVVRPVGVTSNGAMGAPDLPRDTAWYKFGPKPGEVGSAVIAGHKDWWNGITGVFKNLKTLKPGDVITVKDDQGTATSFVVRKIREYGRKDDASDVFISSDGKAHLNLVTCSGAWDSVFKTYSKRLVVFSDKVEASRFGFSTKTVEE